MKYTRKYTTDKGETRWTFIPPEDCRLAGVVKTRTFQDGRAARYEIPRLVERVEAFRRGELVEGDVGPRSKIKNVINHYLRSSSFRSLSAKSQKSYEASLKVISNDLGDINLNKLTSRICAQFYDQWLQDKGSYAANRYSLILSVFLNYCISIELLEFNPMSRVKKQTHEPKSIVWTKEQVQKFLEKAFSEFEYRSVGLIVLMCYEWAQRPIDIRNLKWENIDFEQRKVTIRQTKRGATVQLPLEEPLFSMLEEQKNLWDFQEYVVPHHRASDNAYRPLSDSTMSKLVNEVKELVGLPKELLIGHLRKTAINEMVEASIDSTSIMQVTGHKNISSLSPYIKHTYSGAKSALKARSNYMETLSGTSTTQTKDAENSN